MLLDQPVEVFTLLLVSLVFQRGLGLCGGVGQAIEVAQLEALRAIHIILQRRL
jgi:hypothetical protein